MQELVKMLEQVVGIQVVSTLVNSFGNALRDNVRIINMSMTWRQKSMNAHSFGLVLKIFENVMRLLQSRRLKSLHIHTYIHTYIT